jgi:hypothetical protein
MLYFKTTFALYGLAIVGVGIIVYQFSSKKEIEDKTAQ